MQSRDTFSGYHPAINFLYFALVLAFSMFLMHPVCLVVSLTSAITYCVLLDGRKAGRMLLRFLLPVMLMAAILNPAFSHEGSTILAYLPSGNPLTLESILYGAASALMLASVITWFTCYSAVMTSDKFVYLFGRVIPALSLLLSMTLRFVPKFVGQFRVVREAQMCIGRGGNEKSFRAKICGAAATLSIMVTWCLENAIDTADSMRSRGYGIPGRTAFSIYKFDERDRYALIWLIFCGVFVTCGAITGALGFRYFPTVKGSGGSVQVFFEAVYLALCLTPVIIDVRENLAWKHLKSEI